MYERILSRLEKIERYSMLGAKNVLSFDDVALLTGLSKSYLYKLTSSGKIPHYKPSGKMIYFDRKELENWMRQNRVTSTDEIDEMADNYLAIGG